MKAYLLRYAPTIICCGELPHVDPMIRKIVGPGSEVRCDLSEQDRKRIKKLLNTIFYISRYFVRNGFCNGYVRMHCPKETARFAY